METQFQNLNIEELTWNSIRGEVKKSNAKLAEFIDQIDPGKSLTLIKARYAYGNKIFNKGIFHLPTKDNSTISLEHHLIPSSIKKSLDYSSIPVSIILNKSVEVFFETDERVMPSKLLPLGALFGLWEKFDPMPPEFVRKVWSLSAGARSVFMLPKISDATAHERLKKGGGIHAYPPKTLLDHHNVFTQIAHCTPNQHDPWFCDLLFFTGKWFDHSKESLPFLKLYNYFLAEAWQQAYSSRNQMSYNVGWEAFSKETARKNLKPRLHTMNTIKHLIAVAAGVLPGFRPAAKDDESAAPIRLIQHAYTHHYLLKNYAPLIMQPYHLDARNPVVYYSLSFPTLLEYVPQSRSSISIMADMRELKRLIAILLASMKNESLDYDYFHAETDRFSEIKCSKKIVEEDHTFFDPTHFDSKSFPENSPFLHGCIKIFRHE